MALNIIINKVSVAASFAAGATVATAVASGGTAPYIYSLATGGDKFAINSSTGVVTTIAAMDINNIASFSVTATDSTTETALTGTSSVTYPPIQSAIQNRFNKPNTIYKVTKDITLSGGTLTIPAGCTLDFQGGSFTNGTIICNNTYLSFSGKSSIFNNITIEGSINSDLFLSLWKVVPKQNIAPIVENGLYALTRNKHRFVIDIDCYISSYASVPSNSDLYINKDVTITSSRSGGFTVMNRNTSVYKYNGASNVTIHGEGIFDFNSRTYNSPTNSAIQLYHCSDVTIEGLTFKDPASYHVIEIGSSTNVNIRNCKFYGFRPIATSALPESSIKGECIQIEHSKAGNAGIEVPYFDNVECRDINISNNLFDGLYEYDEEGNKIYDTYMWRPIGCHEDHTGGDVGNTYHEGLVVSNNIFNSVKQVCITPRYINNCEIINNIANDLYGIFVSGLPVGKNFYNVSFDFNNAKIVGNVIKFNKDMTSNTLVSSIWTIGRNNWGAIDLMGCTGTTIFGNEIYNAPNSCIILNCCPNTLIEGNKFCEWNTIDKNKGAASSNRAAVDIMDDTPEEGNNQVKEVTTNVSMSGNLFFDTWESFSIRPFTRDKADIENSWNIIDNVFNIKNPAWKFIPPTTVNALDLSSFGSALVNGHPVWNVGFKGKSFTDNNSGRNIYFNGTTWLNEDGTLLGKVGYVAKDIDFTDAGKIYKIVEDINLGSSSLTIPANSTLDFQGGTIKGGTVTLNNTMILPLGCNIKNYITSTITGSYRKGQILFDDSINKCKLWNGTAWVNLDGTALA